ncbi:MAG: DJ-1/PfpI family protein [Deltaproteobacteria bacterium]|nr:DJ-1/PfpI family protein [Deltaproteobacteria bacterium]
MKIGFVIFNGMTTLDFIGVFDPLCRLKKMNFLHNLSWEICAFTDEVKDDFGFSFRPDRRREPLEGYDLLVFPGGLATRTLIYDESFVAWIAAGGSCKLLASVCTGALLLGAAGLLAGLPATTHHSAFSILEHYAAEVRRERIVDCGKIITAGGVSASIDLGLYLCERLAGRDARIKLQHQMDYRAYPEDIAVLVDR